MEAYAYESLAHTTDTRVIDLQPGGFDDEIRCVIRNIELDAVEYEALSYVWGTSPERAVALCGTASIQIPISLHTALRYFRYTDRPRTLWADSMSINQADNVEKAYHVENMGQIYAKSRRVLMWQGESDERSEGALAALEQLMKALTAGKGSQALLKIFDDGKYAREHMEFNKKDAHLQGLCDPNYTAIAAMLERPYFSRMWTLQEGILATDALMVLGNSSMPLSVVREASMTLVVDRETSVQLIDAVSNIFNLVSDDAIAAKQHFSDMLLMLEGTRPEAMQEFDDTSHLMCLMKQTAYRESTDPRDSVFALLHLASDVDLSVNGLMTPTYQIPPEDVYHRTAMFLVLERGCYNWLAYAKGRFSEDPPPPMPGAESPEWCQKAKTPTWVPLKQSKASLITMHYRGTVGHYWTLGGSTNARRFSAGRGAAQTPIVSPDTLTLSLLGRLVDEVAPAHSSPDLTSLVIPSNLLAGCWRIAKELRLAPAGYAPIYVMWMYNSMRGCFGDGWKETVEPDGDMCLLLARCHQMISHLTLEQRASLIRGLLKRFYASARKELVVDTGGDAGGDGDGEEALDMTDVNSIAEELTNGCMFKLRRTVAGRFALLPFSSKGGDRIAVINGLDVPLVVRPDGKGAFAVVGDCSVSGMMDGEALARHTCAEERLDLV